MRRKLGRAGIECNPTWKVDGKPWPTFCVTIEGLFCLSINLFGIQIFIGHQPEGVAWPKRVHLCES